MVGVCGLLAALPLLEGSREYAWATAGVLLGGLPLLMRRRLVEQHALVQRAQRVGALAIGGAAWVAGLKVVGLWSFGVLGWLAAAWVTSWFVLVSDTEMVFGE